MTALAPFEVYYPVNCPAAGDKYFVARSEEEVSPLLRSSLVQGGSALHSEVVNHSSSWCCFSSRFIWCCQAKAMAKAELGQATA